MNNPSLRLHEVSDLLKTRDWSNFKNDKSEYMNPKCGLYILIFENFRDVSINDRNINRSKNKNTLSGKIIIPPNRWVVKFGKFETYFFSRMKGYSDHMHFIDNPQKNHPTVFSQVLRSTILLPLDDCKLRIINPAAMFEPLWNASLHDFLYTNEYLIEEQNFRSEYRVVKKIDSADLELISNFGQKVADKITRISNIL